MNSKRNKQYKMVVKRGFDICAGIIGSGITGILAIPISIAIKCDSPGTVFYTSDRVGRDGVPFKMWKFRTMYPNAERDIDWERNEMTGPIYKMKDDPRITKTGRFLRRWSLDEMPNLFNVVTGDMSLVGTRPPTVQEYEQYEERHKRRLAMKPGITGLWQVSGRNEVKDFEKIVKIDLEYIENWSLLLDVKILLKTVGVVISGRGAQ